MKKRTALIPGLILAALLVIGLAIAGILVFGDRNAAAAGGSDQVAQAAQQATPAPTVPPNANQTIVAQGKLMPVQHAALSMAASGVVAQVLVHEGDPVQAGQVILRLQSDQQQAALAEADASLSAAQAQLDGLKAGPRQAQIVAAQANVDMAKAELARLQEQPRPGEVAAARAAVTAAQANLNQLYAGPTQDARIAAEAELSNAEAAVQSAQAAYDQVKSQPDIAMLPQSLQLQQATNNYNAAKARYDALFAAPETNAVDQARALLKQAQANLDALLNPATPAQIAQAEATVRQAQAQLDQLMAGPTDYQVAAAAAAVDQANAARQQAAAALADTELKSPITGTLAALNVKEGELVTPAAPVAEVADLTAWQVQTTDLTELDVVRVTVGQKVGVTFDALPGEGMSGTVTEIQSFGVEKLGDMTYTVTVQLDHPDPRLRWNMTAVVTVP